MKLLLVLAVMTATCEANAAAVKYESLGKYVKIAEIDPSVRIPIGIPPSTTLQVILKNAATGFIEAYGNIGGAGASTTMALNSGWLNFTEWTRVTWTCPAASNWATLYIDGANSATAPAHGENASPINASIIVGSTPNGWIDPCPRWLRWRIADTGIASGVSAVINWRATR